MMSRTLYKRGLQVLGSFAKGKNLQKMVFSVFILFLIGILCYKVRTRGQSLGFRSGPGSKMETPDKHQDWDSESRVDYDFSQRLKGQGWG